MIYTILIHNEVSNGWDFMKLILSVYNQYVVMHMKFCQDILSFSRVIALACLNVNIFVFFLSHSNVSN